jgi:hypothetical protein
MIHCIPVLKWVNLLSTGSDGIISPLLQEPGFANSVTSISATGTETNLALPELGKNGLVKRLLHPKIFSSRITSFSWTTTVYHMRKIKEDVSNTSSHIIKKVER